MKNQRPAILIRLKTAWKQRRLLRWTGYGSALLLTALSALLLAIHLVPFDESRLHNLDISTTVFDRENRFLRAYLTRDERWRIPAKLDEVSPWVIKATLAAEDKRFYAHHGIDWLAVGRAVVANVKSGRVVSGASTISMQVAGFMLDSRERSLTRKLRQAFLALQLETHWSKKEILECYLTHASYGGNVCGIEAAARRYFNKTSAELSVGEAALLSGVPQSPERFRPDRYLARATTRREFVLEQLLARGDIAKADYARTRKLPLGVGNFDIPVKAPHYCDLVHSFYSSRKTLHTTLDAGIQFQAENALRRVVDAHRSAGVTNGSIVILANKTAEVLAYVGSADYWNRYDSGQVNGPLGFRSPGSALKPLFYGQAMDRGLLEPDEMLYDVPITLAGYSPMNYDRQFRGPIPAAKALAWSLNIPAIEVLKRVGVGEFRDELAQAGVPLKLNPLGDPGLSLAIGTCSVRLLDLASAYSSLARDGVKIKPVWLTEAAGRDNRPSGQQWISKSSARAILNILADTTIRAPEDRSIQLRGMEGIAWKTGTSNGFRDAWTFAVTDKYTVGVWLGNMDGKPSRALVGGKIAAPLALELAQGLKHSISDSFAGDTGMEYGTVCLASGLLPGPDCSRQVTGRLVSGAGGHRKCNIHKGVLVDETHLYELCARCQEGHTAERMTVARYPADVTYWLRANGHAWSEDLVPPHNPACIASREGQGPVIITPKDGSKIIHLAELPSDFQKIALEARTDDPAATLHWFLNGNVIGTAKAHDALRINPVAGRHIVKCVDNRGRTSEITFSVQEDADAREKEKWSHLSDSN